MNSVSFSGSGKLVLVVFTILPLIFMGIGGHLAWSQQKKITTYQPVEARILSTDIERHRGSKSTTYKPVADYTYQVAGHEYRGHDITPIHLSSGYSWAQSIVSRYRPGQATTAYYNPHDPAEVFLLKQYSFFPYIFILFPMLFLAIAMAVLFSGGASTKAPPEPSLQSDGWYALQPTTHIADRQRAALWITVGWLGVGMLACGHYFLAARPNYEMLGIVASSIYGGLGCVSLGMTVYYARLRRNVDDAQLAVSAATFGRGDEFKARAEQMIHQDLHIQELSISLVCEETMQERSGSNTRTSPRKLYEDRLPVVPDNYVRAGNNLTATAMLRVPTDRPSSTPPTERGYPRYDWRIEIVTRIGNSPDYRARFPITVR